MNFHKWRRLPTKHFGEVWVPFAQIELKGNGDRLHAIALQIDSGAVVSLLARSVADLLELDLESGEEVELSSVGGRAMVAFVHSIDTVFADGIRYPVRYAIATTEDVPNLLGRLDVFDHLQIDFDATRTGTLIAPPWLNEEQRRMYDFLIETEDYILQRWSKMELPDRAREAARRLMNRMGQLYSGALALLKLHRTYSAPLYIRSMFETWLQLEYILRDPADRAKRAELYLEFEHVTRYRRVNAIVNNPSGPFGQKIASSSMRAEGEPRNQREYDRVRSMFEFKTRMGKKEVGKNWYGMSIAKLAESLGYGGEYRIVYASCSDWAHANPSQTNLTDRIGFSDPANVFMFCFSYYARTLKSIADAGKIILSDEQYGFLKKSMAQWH